LRGLSRDPQERFPAMTELMAELAKNPDSDLRNGHAAQWRLAATTAATASVITGLGYLSRMRGSFTLHSMLVNSCVLLAVVSVAAFRLRRSLLRNDYYRGMVTILLCTLVEMVFSRVLALRLKLSLVQFIPLDLGIAAGFASIIGALYLRGALVVSVGLAATALFFSWSPESVRPYTVLAYPLAVGAIMYLSQRASHNSPSPKQRDADGSSIGYDR
jgi:hypothetical protein